MKYKKYSHFTFRFFKVIKFFEGQTFKPKFYFLNSFNKQMSSLHKRKK